MSIHDQQNDLISIHAPARGATVGIAMLPPKATHFNPRPREGGDCDHRAGCDGRPDISIHAPARGATLSS